MFEFPRRDSRDLIETVAEAQGISVEEMEREMQAAIAEARNDPNPERQAEFRKYFGDRTPTPEEFISTMSKMIKQ